MKSILKENLAKLRELKPSQSSANQSLKRSDKVAEDKKPKDHKIQEKTMKQQERKSKKLFSNITFCFPHFDVDLTKRQAECITKQILAEGGKVIEYGEHLYFQPIQYILVSTKARVQTVQKKIEEHLNYIDILDYNYVPCCIAQEKTIDPAKFSLINNKDIQIDEQKKERKGSKKSGIKRLKSSQEENESKVEQKSITEELPPSDEDDEDDPQKRNFGKADKEKFFCQAGKKDDKPAMNKFIEDQLLELQKIYANERDIGRRIAYGKAASMIRTWKEEIKTEEDVDKIPGIGPKINKKIKEIVTTGKLKKLQQLNQSQEVVALGKLSNVWGIGPAKAKQLYRQGIKSIEELRENQSSLTKNQKIGLKYYQDFQKRIPREKVQKMFAEVKKGLAAVTANPQAYKSEVCGSYRRGKATCGDMDIIITRKDGIFEKDLLVKLVAQLHKRAFLTDNLSDPKCNEGHVSTSYMGVCVYDDETHHRIDIKHYPLEQYAFALLYFTGSGMFNRSMRLYATKLGLQLSDKGFALRPQKGGAVWKKAIPVCYTEQDVFKVLGLDYKTPKQRDD